MFIWQKHLKMFFSLTTDLNALIIGMEHHLGKEIQMCSNEVLKVMYGSPPGASIFV